MNQRIPILLVLALMLLSGCKGEKKIAQYGELYQEQPQVILIAPVNDMTTHRAVREISDSLYNESLATAAMQLYLTAADPLTYHGYYVMGPLASAQLMATEKRTGKQLRNDNINDYYTDLGVDAILFIDILSWTTTSNKYSVELEYTMRSTHTNSELLHVHVNATKICHTDFKGNPQPLKEDLEFQQRYGCTFDAAQRCRLVEIVNQYVFNDLPAGDRARQYRGERYVKSHPEYFSLRIHKDGSVELMNGQGYED